MILHIIKRETAFSATGMIPNDKLNPSIRHRCAECHAVLRMGYCVRVRAKHKLKIPQIQIAV